MIAENTGRTHPILRDKAPTRQVTGGALGIAPNPAFPLDPNGTGRRLGPYGARYPGAMYGRTRAARRLEQQNGFPVGAEMTAWSSFAAASARSFKRIDRSR